MWECAAQVSADCHPSVALVSPIPRERAMTKNRPDEKLRRILSAVPAGRPTPDAHDRRGCPPLPPPYPVREEGTPTISSESGNRNEPAEDLIRIEQLVEGIGVLPESEQEVRRREAAPKTQEREEEARREREKRAAERQKERDRLQSEIDEIAGRLEPLVDGDRGRREELRSAWRTAKKTGDLDALLSLATRWQSLAADGNAKVASTLECGDREELGH